MNKLKLSLWCLIALIAQASFAQTFSSVDIMPGSLSGSPYGLHEFNGKAYFSAAGDTLYGNELWVSDGTPAGTVMLADIWPGRGSSGPYGFTAVGAQLFFSAYDSVHGYELWVTDGTSPGTRMVADIGPGRTGSNPSIFTAFNGKLYFSADDSIHGAELWVSDGTQSGTAMIKDINPGSSASSIFGSSVVPSGFNYNMNEYNGKLYFRANDGVHGIELWTTDGTTSGTVMVADIWPGPGDGRPYCITPFNGKMYMAGKDSLHGFELWVSDGTSAGTALVKDINTDTTAGSDLANFSGFIPFGNKLYFQAKNDATGYELYSTDGTSAGTTLVKDIWPGPTSSNAGYFDLIAYNGSLYFPAKDSINNMQLWISDGTSAGTSMLKMLSSYSYNAFPTKMINYNNRLVFTAATDSVNKRQLWTSDGTAAGTHTISPPISPNSNPLANDFPMCIAGGKLFMNAGFTSIGYELWIYSTPTGITEASGEHAISAYPNPFSTVVSLSGLVSGEQYDVQVLDMTGREFYRSAVSADQNTISMPELGTGVYLMTVSGQSHSQTFKLVKQ
jgi:ELWxxDGT repeat protein